MIRVVLELDDAVAAAYDQQALGLDGVSPETMMVRALTRFKHVPLSDRTIVLTTPELRQLDAVTSPGYVRSAEDLVERVLRLASLKIGGIDVPWTPGQLEELRRRAEKNGRTPEEEAYRVAREIGASFFDRV